METYDRILDLIFASEQSTKGRIIFSLTLRTTPAFRPESQVTMSLFQDRKARLEFAVAKQNVYHSSNEAFRIAGRSDPDILAQKTVVSRYTVDLPPARILEWQHGLFMALDPTFKSLQAELTDTIERRPVALLLDGDTHEVWYTQGSEAIHVKIPESATRSPFDKWAEAVQEAVSKMVQPSSHSVDSIK
jgi:hypothetical protein